MHRASDAMVALVPMIALLAMLLGAWSSFACAQDSSSPHVEGAIIEGVVADSKGVPQPDAVVRLSQQSIAESAETKTNKDGAFLFSALKPDHYTLIAEKSGLHSRTAAITATSQADHLQMQLVLEDPDKAPSVERSAKAPPSMEFADKPNFTVAGVVDWTAVGGHGSDSSLRTSESLVRQTTTLKKEENANSVVTPATEETERALRAKVAADPADSNSKEALGRFYLSESKFDQAIPLLQSSCATNSVQYDCEYTLALAHQGAGEHSKAREDLRKISAQNETADSFRLAGELDEKLGDPLPAVHEFERAAIKDPSEQNYFEYGSELLKHRAVWQAQQILQKGVEAFPQSARMLLALGTAFFSGARYDDAARRFCDASDLNPANPEPYLLMGQMQLEAPNPLPCVDQKLERFAAQQPGNAMANYYYAMSIWKGQQHGEGQPPPQRVEALLKTAAAIDPQCGDAYLQLGNLSSSRRNFAQAIDFYQKAISANSQLAEAHYRLGVAYDRVGDSIKAKQEFELHGEIKKREAAAIEQQRKDVKQFLIVLPDQAPNSGPGSTDN